MVKTVLSVAHEGLRDWIVQRVSAIYMAIYTIGLVAFFMMHSELSFFEWQGWFDTLWVKIATLLFVLSVLTHAWVGMWTVFTDYVTCYVVRCILNVVVYFSLLAFFFAALLILWGV